MRILRHDELQLDPACPTFRNKSWMALWWTALIMWGIAIYTFLPKGRVESSLWGFVPLVFGAFLFLLMLERMRVCLRREAWLLRQAEEGLYVNLRSCYNYHLPREEHRVLFIPANEIAAICKTHETRHIPDRRGSHTDQVSYIDIYLTNDATQELREVLRHERRLMPRTGRFRRTKRHDYPVRVIDPPGVRLVWDWIKPGESRALDSLSRQFPLAPDQRLTAKRWEKMTPDEREAFILELWEWGHLEDAVRLGRLQWNVGEWRARKRIEEEIARG